MITGDHTRQQDPTMQKMVSWISYTPTIYPKDNPHLSILHMMSDVAREVAAEEFANRFDHVAASDANASSLDSARRFLAAASIPQAKLSFSQYIGEALAEHHPLQSADLIGVAECITLYG
jgi:hypothetical protein